MLTYVGTTTSTFLGFRQVPPNEMWFKVSTSRFYMGAWRKLLLSESYMTDPSF